MRVEDVLPERLGARVHRLQLSGLLFQRHADVLGQLHHLGAQRLSRGDLIVRVIVEVPTKLNGEQRRKLQELADLMGEENSPLHKGFFDKAKEFFR